MNESEFTRSNESEETTIQKYVIALDQSNFTETPTIMCQFTHAVSTMQSDSN